MINFGAFNYDYARIASILEITVSEVEESMKNPDSQLFKCYHKGRHISEYVIDTKLFELAQMGDLKALNELERRKNARL